LRFGPTSATSGWPPLGTAAVIRMLPSSGVASGIHHTFGVRFANVLANERIVPFVQGCNTSRSAACRSPSVG